MTRLAIIRHGHTPWNHAGRIQGRTDIALDPEAARVLSQYCLPKDWAGADLVSSPLSRARETARLIADRDATAVEALTEMNWGDWEGLRGLDLKQDPKNGFRDIEDWGWDYHPPGGESPADMWHRIAPWIASLRRDTVAVCHIGIMRTILAQAHGWGFSGPAPFRIKRNWLFIVNLTPTLTVGDPERVKLLER